MLFFAYFYIRRKIFQYKYFRIQAIINKLAEFTIITLHSHLKNLDSQTRYEQVAARFRNPAFLQSAQYFIQIKIPQNTRKSIESTNIATRTQCN